MRRDAPGSWAAPTCGPRILNRLAEGGIRFENRLLRLPVGSPAHPSRPSELAHGLYLHPGKRGVVPGRMRLGGGAEPDPAAVRAAVGS